MTGKSGALTGAGGNLHTTGPQGGGNKKAGLAPTATSFMLGMPFNRALALGKNGRANGGHKIFILSRVNQLGSVGSNRSATRTGSDGVNINRIKQAANYTKQSVNLNSFQNVFLEGINI